MLVRWWWPRFRFDQLMTLAWKVMLPLGVVNLVAVAVLQRGAAGGLAGRLVQHGGGQLGGVFSAGWVVFAVAWLVVALDRPARHRQSAAAWTSIAMESTCRFESTNS